LSALSTELVLYQRRALGMSSADLKRCWGELVDAIAAA